MAVSKKPVAKKPVTKRVGRPAAKKVVQPKQEEVQQPAVEEKEETVTDSVTDDLVIKNSIQEELNTIDCFDLRDRTVTDKIVLIKTLQDLGYLFADAIEEAPTEKYMTYLTVDAIRLQHTNKLIYTLNWEEVEANHYASHFYISNVDYGIGFTEPSPTHPSIIEVGSAKYIRVA